MKRLLFLLCALTACQEKEEEPSDLRDMVLLDIGDEEEWEAAGGDELVTDGSPDDCELLFKEEKR
jgi:hypothetical protein